MNDKPTQLPIAIDAAAAASGDAGHWPTVAGILADGYRALRIKQDAITQTWRNIGELGEIAYMSDGSRQWALKGDWETMKLFLVYMKNGDVQTHFAYIDEDDGMLRDSNGDDVGWLWCDADYYMNIPAKPPSPNATELVVCGSEESLKIAISRLQPYQKSMVDWCMTNEKFKMPIGPK